MRPRYIIASSALALSTMYAVAGVKATSSDPMDIASNVGIGSSRAPVPPRALDKGAVYELQLRLRSGSIEEYLADYARWYLPADQNKNSGRKLLSVITREHGNHYNLVFLYWYENAYKQNYYCKYLKAFFEYHAKANAADFIDKYYRPTLLEWGEDVSKKSVDELIPRLKATIGKLPLECADSPSREEELAAETLHKVDLDLSRNVELDEGSWNFGVDLCKVAKLHNAREQREEITTATLNKACPQNQGSMLERSIEWEKNQN
jgi:hypothetical protein